MNTNEAHLGRVEWFERLCSKEFCGTSFQFFFIKITEWQSTGIHMMINENVNFYLLM